MIVSQRRRAFILDRLRADLNLKTGLMAMTMLCGLASPISAQACTPLYEGDLLEQIVIEYYTSDREDDDFYAIFVPVQRVIRVNGVQKSFPATQILELTQNNVPQNSEHIILAEFVENHALDAAQTEVTVLVHEMGALTFVVANQCGEIQRIVR